MIRLFVAAFVILLMPSVALADADPATSEYLKTVGGGTALDTKDGNRFAYFGIVVAPTKPLPQGVVLVAEFENPSDPSSPLRTFYTPKPDEKQITIRSEIYQCIANGRDYRVSIKIYADAEKKKLLSVHEQPIAFNVPKKMFAQMGLRECGS